MWQGGGDGCVPGVMVLVGGCIDAGRHGLLGVWWGGDIHATGERRVLLFNLGEIRSRVVMLGVEMSHDRHVGDYGVLRRDRYMMGWVHSVWRRIHRVAPRRGILGV